MNLQRIKIIPALLVLGLFGIITSVGMSASSIASNPAGFAPPVTSKVGEVLFTEFLAPLEMVGVLLVSALIGGVYLAKRDVEEMEAVEEAVRMKPQVDATEAEETMGVTEDGSR